MISKAIVRSSSVGKVDFGTLGHTWHYCHISGFPMMFRKKAVQVILGESEWVQV